MARFHDRRGDDQIKCSDMHGPSSTPRALILRSEAEKREPERTWARPDIEFFCAGACHVLCGVFLRTNIGKEYAARMIIPAKGMRGIHVFASDGVSAFDAYGLEPLTSFLTNYKRAGRATSPSWTYSIKNVPIDPLSREFCERFNHRHPNDFPGDVVSRATTFLKERIPKIAIDVAWG